MKTTIQQGKPYASLYARLEEGKVASAATPRRGSLLYNSTPIVMTMVLFCALALMAFAHGAEAPKQGVPSGCDPSVMSED